MAVTKTFAGNSYELPLNREPKGRWGTPVSNFLIALADNAIPKTGGSYTLSAELNFGAAFGILAPYLKSAAANTAATGALRLANNETIAWRNAANSADLTLKANASDILEFSGAGIAGNVSGTATNVTGIVAPANGGTGIANDAAATLTRSGAHALTLTTTGVTSVTLPTTGTLATFLQVQNEVSTHAGLTNSHGVSGSIVGTSGVQTLNQKTISGAANTLTNIPLSTAVTGTLPIANGGTGQATATDAINALLPSQASASGKVLSSDGTNIAWAAALTTTLADGKIFLGNVSNVATAVTPTGDVTISNTGVTAIASGVIVAGDFASGAEVSQSVRGVVKNAGQLLGTNTNDSAAAGYVGEIMTTGRNRSGGQALTNNVISNVSSGTIVLTAGDWEISGAVGFQPAASTSITGLTAAISATSATLPATDTYANYNASGESTVQNIFAAVVLGGGGDITLTFPTVRVSIASGNTVTLRPVAVATFTVSTLSTYGVLKARRVR